MREHYALVRQANAEILAISSEDRRRAAQLKAQLDLPFPILADNTRRVIATYGVFHQNEPKGRPIARPAIFVLDADGIIRYRYVGKSATDRPELETILETVKDVTNRHR